MICKKCRKEIPENAIFCQWCGKKQTQAERIKKRPNGTGSVYKASGTRSKPWRAVVTEGKRKITIGYYSTQTEALKAIASYEPAHSSVKPDMTLEEVYNAWSEVKYESVSKQSVDTYKAAWARLSHLKHVNIAAIKTQDYQKIIDEMKTKLSRSSCEKFRILVSQLCQWAMNNDIIEKNYSDFLVLPSKKESGEREYFTTEEIYSIWEHSDELTAKIILTMIYTGMRINELFTLQRSDVHLNEQITATRSVSYVVGGEKTEAGRNRVIVLHSRIIPFFVEWMNHDGGKYVVFKTKGKQIDDANFRKRDYYPFLKKIGIPPIPPHKARHTFATIGAKSGISPTVLQGILGHEKYETTADYYTHVDILQLADGIELFNP